MLSRSFLKLLLICQIFLYAASNTYALTELTGVTQISAGAFHTCALLNTGAVKCWGRNSFGQLGDNSTTNKLTPVQVDGLTSGVSAIALGGYRSCAVLNNGDVKCWGYNGDGQLSGDGGTNRLTPVLLNNFSDDISSIALGYDHICILLDTGGVKCWGQGDYGQLGRNSDLDSMSAVQVDGLTSGVSKIALGSNHSCALLNTGALKCWGFNDSGQLGDNSTTNRLTPVQVDSLTSGVSDIGANALHSCAVVSGALKCWGVNDKGELGDNSTTDSLIPVQVDSLTSGVSAFSLFYDGSCALLDSGTVKCWGYNYDGQLGDTTSTDRLTPVQVDSLTSGISEIVSGSQHSCALLDSGTVKCWGQNTYGAIGDNSTSNSNTPVSVLVALPEINLIGNGNNIVDGDTTPSTTDATDFGNTTINTPVDKTFTIQNIGDGDLVLSGSPIVGLSGAGCTMFSVTSQPTSPIASSSSDSFTIQYNPTAAAIHNCTVNITNDDLDESTYDFAIKGVGNKINQTITFNPPATGALGYSTTLSATADSGLTVNNFASTTTNICTVSGTTLNFIDAGTCTVTADQAGNSSYNTATQVSQNITVYHSLENVTQISGGGFHTCALVNGGVKCWGLNDSGQLGDNSTTASSVPVDVNGLTSGVSAISVNYKHSCALLDTNGVKCWGWNSNGQLGDNSTTNRSTPVDVNGLSSGVSAIVAGGSHTCALLDTREVKCWGYNFGGELGNNSTVDSSIPVNVNGLSSDVSMISLGGSYSCALLNTGGAKCWGYNGYGQVGDGSTTNRLTPVDVSGLTSGVSTIISSNSNGCALLNTSELKCWGKNTNGQIGDNSTIERHTPVDVSGLSSGVSSVAFGEHHGCALLDTRGAKCWGYNGYGQVGDGSTTNRLTPVDVNGLSSGISAISLGFNHSCVLLDTGNVACWGSNSNGQLGDNSTTNRSVPVHVKVLFPEINLVGNSNNISNGDTTPSTTDDTDFGSTPINTPVDQTFTIENIGQGNLTLSGSPIVALTGADCSMFSITSQPTSPISSSASSNFTIQYNPTAAATHNCTVSIANDDTNESTYNFAITGTGVTAEINVLGNNNAIADGDITPDITDGTDFGSTELNIPINKTFTIENTGLNQLTLSGSPIVALMGADCGMFSVTSQPSSPIAINASDNFTVQYNPTVLGKHNCTISIDNDDVDENPYDFAITGTGVTISAPSDFTANTPSINNIDQGISLSWTDNSANEGEFILLRDGSQLATITANSTSYTDTNATECNTNYSYSLKAQNLNNESTSVSVTANMPDCPLPEPAPPNAPINLIANPTSHNQIQLTWTDDSSIETGYRIERNGMRIAILDKNTETYTDDDLTCESTYTYDVYSYNSIGESSHITTTVTTLTCPPNTLGQLTTTITSDSITLIWEDVEGETGYLVARESLNTRKLRAIQEFDLPADSTSFTDTDFECGQTYNYDVFAVFGTTLVPATTTTVETLPCITPPAAPSQLIATLNDENQIVLSWQDNSLDETGFVVLRDGQVLAELTADTITYSDNDLACGTVYQYQILAKNDDGDSLPSDPVNIEFPCVILQAPANLTFTPSSYTQIELTWLDNNTAEIGYQIIRDGYILHNTTQNSSNFIDTNLHCGTQYHYLVSAIAPDLSISPATEIFASTQNCIGEFSLNLNIQGQGNVNGCSHHCKHSYPENQAIALHITPVTNWQFSHWSGDCSSNQIVLDTDKNCTAYFIERTVEVTQDNEEFIEQIATEEVIIPITEQLPITEIPAALLPPPPARKIEDNSTLDQSANIAGQTVTNIDIQQGSSVSNGTLGGEVNNSGLISNIIIEQGATVSGGSISGNNINNGTMEGVTITTYSEVTGGSFSGDITNRGTLFDAKFLEGTTVTGGKLGGIIQCKGTIKDVQIHPYARIIGGQIGGFIQGTKSKPAYLGNIELLAGSKIENVRISPTTQLPDNIEIGEGVIFPKSYTSPDLEDFGVNESNLDTIDAYDFNGIEPAAFELFEPEHIAQLPLEVFAEFEAEDIEYLQPEAVETVAIEQFEKLPEQALEGLSADNVDALNEEILAEAITPEKLDSIKPEAVKKSKNPGKIFTQLKKIKPKQAKRYLPKDWDINEDTGELSAPVGTKLTYKKVEPKKALSKQKASLPDIADLDSSFSLGGTGGKTAQENLNDAIEQTPDVGNVELDQFVFTQNDDTGMLNIVGEGNYDGTTFAFLPGANNIEQAPLDTPVGLSQDEGGFFIMTMPNYQSFLLTPSSNDPTGLVEVLSDEDEPIEEQEPEIKQNCFYSNQVVKFNERGDTLLKLAGENTRRLRAFETEIHVVVIFDAFVVPAPEQYCKNELCDWPIMPEDLQKGLHLPDKLRARQQARVIYPDGSAQLVYPTVLEPNTFISVVSELEGIEKVIYQADGTFKAVYFGETVLIYPTFDTYLTPLPNADEEIEPEVDMIGAKEFSYTVQDCARLVTTTFVIE
ncbi:choice-of-anchor D domain-containing protein [Candidatus Albibeggiatoa sp. nov. NOAA]|uniref:RCC1 domain-containing protein n=1 Tax=Candidatus Albibeggiatoa sp. nov. NOAA TaxID=3162724 RepID=UPI0032F7E150|nr:choice-of-anchor D domain-containing protein [Thiotrichaceae bacterium]